MANLTTIATLQASVNNNSTVTVPAGVTSAHLGIAVFMSANIVSTGSIPAISGWNSKVSNPTVGSVEWTVLTRNGGMNAGDVLTITENKTTQFDLYMIWYDAGGMDIVTIGTPGGRSGTSSSTTVIPGITTMAIGQNVIAIATEQSPAAGTRVSSWSGNYAPATDSFVESASAAATSNLFAHFPANAAAATGNLTASYNMTSGVAVGILLGLAVPSLSSFHDQFTTTHWATSGSDPTVDWYSTYSDSQILMSGGALEIPFLSGAPFMYPKTSFAFANSQVWAEVTMQDNQVGTFSMRLTTDNPAELGHSFTSIGISAGGALYTNERVYTGGTATDSIHTFTVNAGLSPIGLRIRHGGGTLVYYDYTYDNINWYNLDARNISAFNPATDYVRLMFQTGTSDSSDHMTTYAVVQNLNASGWIANTSAPWVGAYTWSYWDGAKEVQISVDTQWSYALFVTYPAYPDTTVYPDADYPGPANYPGGAVYPDFAPIYPS